VSTTPHPSGPAKIDRHQAINGIVASIAMMEASIAHILNADGQNIQLIIAATDCGSPNAYPQLASNHAAALNALIDANNSVAALAKSVAYLESRLLWKLKIAMSKAGGFSS
jgi:hypothetical protein